MGAGPKEKGGPMKQATLSPLSIYLQLRAAFCAEKRRALGQIRDADKAIADLEKRITKLRGPKRVKK